MALFFMHMCICGRRFALEEKYPRLILYLASCKFNTH
jgi:hypothetical protein